MIRPALGGLARGLAAFVAGIAVAFVVLAWLLSSGPLSLSLLNPYVQAGLARLDLPYRVDFGGTELAWGGWDKRLQLRLKDVRLVDGDGTVVATVPGMAVTLGTRHLLRGVIAPTSLEFIGPRLAFNWTGEGMERGGTGEEGADILIAFARQMAAAPDSTAGVSELRSIRVTGAGLHVVDAVHDLEWRAEDAAILIRHHGADGTVQVTADFRVDDRARGTTWEARSARIDVARAADGFDVTFGAEVPLGGESARVDGRAVIDMGARAARVDARFTPVMPASLAARVPELAPAARLRVPVGGTLGADIAFSGAVGELSFDLFGGDGSIGLPGLIEGEYPVRQFMARGRLEAGLRRLDLQELVLDLNGPVLGAWGTADFTAAHPAIDMVGEGSNLTVEDVLRLWPPPTSPKTHAWILEHITAGKVPRGTIRVRATAEQMAELHPPASVFSARFEINGATVAYLAGLPPVTDVAGQATIENGVIDMRLSSGRSGRVALSDGHLRITDVGQDHLTKLAITLTANAPVRDAMTLLNAPRLRFADRFGFDAAGMEGETSARLGFRFPLRPDLTMEAVDFDADAVLRRLQVRDVLGGHDLEGGELALKLDKDGLIAQGAAAFDGVPLDFAWESRFAEAQPFASRYRLRGRVDESGRAALGYDSGGRLGGPVGASVTVDVMRDGRREIRAGLDLRDATVALPELHWTKPAGAAGSLDLALQQASATAPPALQAFHLSAAGFDARGRGEFDPATQSVRRLFVDRLVYGKTDITASFVRAADGSMTVEARGPRLDVRPFIEGHQAPAAGTAPVWIAFKGELDEVVGIGREPLRAVRATIDLRAGQLRSVELDGLVGAAAPVSYRMTPAEGGRRIKLVTDDGGALLRWYGLYEHAEGGRLELDGFIDDTRPGGPMTGRLAMTEFRVMNAPTLANVLTIGSLPDFVRALRGEGIAFDSLEGDFTWTDAGVQIENARSYGSELGLTMRGRVNLDAQTSDLSGTIVPAYTLNTVLGHVPLLGRLLVGGGKGSGVFAITYNVSGPMSEPRVAVNPLSMLAPGFLRNLFSPAQAPDLQFLKELETQRPDN